MVYVKITASRRWDVLETVYLRQKTYIEKALAIDCYETRGQILATKRKFVVNSGEAIL